MSSALVLLGIYLSDRTIVAELSFAMNRRLFKILVYIDGDLTIHLIKSASDRKSFS